MKNLTVLPADTYIVINKTIITSELRKLVTMLYQPIIGYTSTILYFTLLDDLDKKELMSEDLTHHHLMSTMQLKLQDIVVAREKLEAIGLIKTYYKESTVNSFVYMLFSPLSASEFLNHPILSVVLYNNLGKVEFEKLVSYYKVPSISLKEYNDITKKFNEVFESVSFDNSLNNQNIISNNKGNINLNSVVDFDTLITSIPSSIVSNKCFNDETKELINLMAMIYKIDDLNLQGLVRNSLNERGMLNKNEFKVNCQNFYRFENDGKLPKLIYSRQPDYLKTPLGDNKKRTKMIYTFENVTPYDLLKSAYNGAKPTTRDLQLIENLMVEQKLKPGVVNVLIDYVLKINDKKLNKAYIETIAGQWKRLNIETVTDAMEICEKVHKKNKKNEVKKEASKTSVANNKTPEWFDKDIKINELEDSEKAEINDILNAFQ